MRLSTTYLAFPPHPVSGPPSPPTSGPLHVVSLAAVGMAFLSPLPSYPHCHCLREALPDSLCQDEVSLSELFIHLACRVCWTALGDLLPFNAQETARAQAIGLILHHLPDNYYSFWLNGYRDGRGPPFVLSAVGEGPAAVSCRMVAVNARGGEGQEASRVLLLEQENHGVKSSGWSPDSGRDKLCGPELMTPLCPKHPIRRASLCRAQAPGKQRRRTKQTNLGPHGACSSRKTTG